MTTLEQIVTNHQVMQPVLSFFAGAIIGGLIRVGEYRRYERDLNKKPSLVNDGRSTFASVATGAGFAYMGHAKFGMYVADVAAATIGYILAEKLVDGFYRITRE